MEMELQYLGTAASEGWPALFCHCVACEAARLRGGRDIRTRSQAVVDGELLIDFPADSYWHSIQHGVDLSAVRWLLITHAHHDHFYPADLLTRGNPYSYGMRTPCLHMFGSEYAKALLMREGWSGSDNQDICWTVLHAFEPIAAGPYSITPLPARHMLDRPESEPFIYLIEKDGKALLYAHDTGYLYDEAIAHLTSRGLHLDLVSLDCNNGRDQAGLDYPHMGLAETRHEKARLITEGLCDSHTVFVLNHFSHNGGLPYRELCAEAEKGGCLVSYDGMRVQI